MIDTQIIWLHTWVLCVCVCVCVHAHACVVCKFMCVMCIISVCVRVCVCIVCVYNVHVCVYNVNVCVHACMCVCVLVCNFGTFSCFCSISVIDPTQLQGNNIPP